MTEFHMEWADPARDDNDVLSVIGIWTNADSIYAPISAGFTWTHSVLIATNDFASPSWCGWIKKRGQLTDHEFIDERSLEAAKAKCVEYLENLNV